MQITELNDYVTTVQHDNYVQLRPKDGYTIYHGEELEYINVYSDLVELHFADSFVSGCKESELGNFTVDGV